jgi:hypothetical protein
MTEMPQNVEVAIVRLQNLADTAMDSSLYEKECRQAMRNAIVLLRDAYNPKRAPKIAICVTCGKPAVGKCEGSPALLHDEGRQP